MVRKKGILTEDDDIFTEFDRMFEDIRQSMDLMRSQTGLTPESMPLSYSYRVVIGPNGERQVSERFDDQRDDGPDPDSGREPLTDVREREDGVTVIMQLPGLSREDIGLEVLDKVLVIRVDCATRRFEREVELPCTVKSSTAGVEYRNGVLEVTLNKPTSKRKRGSKVKVD